MHAMTVTRPASQAAPRPTFAEVAEEHLDDVFGYLAYLTRDRGQAEDLASSTFEKALRLWERFDPERGSSRTWLLGIVHNRAIDSLRRSVVHDRRRASDEGLEERFEARERTDVEVARRDEARAIRTILDGLPPDQCRVIELAYFGGFTHTEIAELLNAPIGTVKGRMRLGMEKMRGALAVQGVTSS